MTRTKRNPLKRQIEILKLLQGQKKTTEQIAEYFKPGCDGSFTRSIQKDLTALRDGLEILETTIKIEETTESHSLKSYKSTVHPIFLALNLSELFALLKLLEDNSNEEIYAWLFGSIYGQITEYAEGKIAPNLKNKHDRQSVANRLEQDNYHNIFYLIKSEQPIPITYTTKGNKTITRLCVVKQAKNGIVHFHNIDDKADRIYKLRKQLSEIQIHWGELNYK